MSKEKNVTVETTTENANVNVESATAPTVRRRKPVRVDPMTAIAKAIKDEKSFELIRKIYRNKDKFYDSYSVFMILEGMGEPMFVEMQLLPEIGFTGKDV